MLADMNEPENTTASEAANLKAAFLKWKSGGKGRTQEMVADELGYAGQSAVSQYLNGKIPLNYPALLGFSKLFGVPPSEISPRLTKIHRHLFPETYPINESPKKYELAPVESWDDSTPLGEDEVALPFFKGVELSAGKGMQAMLETGGSKLRFGARTLRNHGVDPAAAVAATVSGSSMAPVMPDGCTIAINMAATQVTDGKIYAVNHAGELRVKLLYRLPGGGLRIRSYNESEYPDEIYGPSEASEIEVLGRVFWYSVLL